MDAISSIQTQTISKFKNPVFATYFMVDNNSKGVISYLQGKGFNFTGNLNSDKTTAKKIILDWYNNRETSKINELLNSVSYMNEGDSDTMAYTKGFRSYFVENTPTSAVDTKVRENIAGREGEFSWDGLFAGLGAGLTTYTSFSGSNTGNSPAYDKAIIEAEEKKKATRTWIIIGSIVGLIALTGIVILVVKNKNKN